MPLIIWQETQTLRFLKMDGNLINSFLPTGCSAQMELSEGEGEGRGLTVVVCCCCQGLDSVKVAMWTLSSADYD